MSLWGRFTGGRRRPGEPLHAFFARQVRWGAITAPLAAGCAELAAQVEALERRVAVLENEALSGGRRGTGART